MIRKIAGNNLFLHLERALHGKVIVGGPHAEGFGNSLWHFVGLRTYQLMPTRLWQDGILEALENETGQH